MLDYISVVEEHQVEAAEALRVGEYVDLDDLPACDLKAQHDVRPSARRPNDPGSPINERESRRPGTPRERLGHDWRAANQPWRARVHARIVGPEYDVPV